MSNQQHWQGYDLLKLLMAIVLILIVIVLVLGSRGKSPDAAVSAAASTAEAAVSPEITVTSTSSPAADVTEPVVPTTNTPSPTATSTATITATPTPTGTSTPTSTPTVTITPTNSVTPVEVADVPAELDSCSLAIDSRLEVGATAVVRTNLNFRAAPGLDEEIQLVHLPGVRLEIIDGPICIRHLDGAYRWWQVQRPDGATGWSAEGSLTRLFYFLDPVE